MRQDALRKVAAEHVTVHGPDDRAGLDDTLQAELKHQRHRHAGVDRDHAVGALLRRGERIPTRHTQVQAEFVEEEEALRIHLFDQLLEGGALLLDLWPSLLARARRLFLRVMPSRCKARQTVARLTF